MILKNAFPRWCALMVSSFVLISLPAHAQSYPPSPSTPFVMSPIVDGPFKPNIDSLKQYQVPEWFEDAKLGIFMHWGPCAVGGIDSMGWYGRDMYKQGNPAYKHQIATMGHPSKVGFKDVCLLFKAEKFDAAQADSLVKLYKEAGAKYIVPVAVHHDNFDMWDSKYQPRWNAKVTTGKDIIGMWKKAADDNGLRFGVSSHMARSYRWFQTSHGSDTTGPLQGVPYDGADPQYADLYGVPWQDSNGMKYEQAKDEAPIDWEKEYELRMRDLIERYKPDLFYVDGGIPFHDYPAGLNVLADFYNSNIANHNGKLEAVANIKLDWVPTIAVLDFEFSTKTKTDNNSGIPQYYWQSDKSINKGWFRMLTDKPADFIAASRVIATLMDNVSRNGNLLLNVPLKPDGTLDPETVKILQDLGKSTSTLGEALYATRAWETFGEGPTDFTKNFPPGTAQDIRFTRDKANTILYATVMAWPGNGATLPIKTLNSGSFDGSTIANISLLGSPAKLTWKQDDQGLNVVMPATPPPGDAFALKITFNTPQIPSLKK